jgi:hypothetical protein
MLKKNLLIMQLNFLSQISLQFQGNKIITSFPGSNKEMEINSSEFIKSMISKYRYIYPGHGNFVII